MHATTLNSWFLAIRAELQARGLDSQALFEQAGIEEDSLNDARARIPLQASTRLWELAVAASGDEALGLAVARQVRSTTFHALGYAVMASPSLERALLCMQSYFRVVSDAAELTLEDRGQTLHFSLNSPAAALQPAPQAIDAFMAVIIRSCRALAGPDFRVHQLHMRRPRPQKPAEFSRMLRIEPQYATATNTIVFEAASARQPLPYGNEELAKHNEQILQKHLASAQSEMVATRVRGLLLKQLHQGEPSQEHIAKQLQLSLRQLQRKLRDEDTSFRGILEQTRRDMAQDLLSRDDYGISEVAWMLGFQDSGSFSLAFKRWTGHSPRAWRSQTSKTAP